MYMKTYEMLKRLEENPKARFVSNKEPNNPIFINEKGILVWGKQGNPFEVNIISTFYAGTLEVYKWKEIKESVIPKFEVGNEFVWKSANKYKIKILSIGDEISDDNEVIYFIKMTNEKQSSEITFDVICEELIIKNYDLVK